MPETAEPKALGISFQVDIGQGMGIVFQTHVDAAQAMNGTLDAILDRIYLAGQRQRAKGEIDGLERHIEGQQKQIDAGNARIEQAEAAHKKLDGELTEKIMRALATKADTDTQAREMFASSGKRGSYTATAQTNQRLAGYDTEVAKAKAERDRIARERDAALAAERHARQVALDEIEKTQEEIERRKALLKPSE